MITLFFEKAFVKNVILATIYFTISQIAAQNDTLYYDANWRVSVKDSASFYRIPIEKEGNLYRMKDYYISGNLQMSGLSSSSSKELWEGVVTWYNENGTVYRQSTYENNRLNGSYSTYLKKKKLKATYKNGYFLSGKQNDVYTSNKLYKERKNDTLKEVIYGEEVNGIRYEQYGTKEDPRIRTKYYGKNGLYLGEQTRTKEGYTKGIEVSYYFKPMRVKEIRYYRGGNLFATSFYYPNGQARALFKEEGELSTTYYSASGELLGKMYYERSANQLKAVNGKRYFFASSYAEEQLAVIVRMQAYKDGSLYLDQKFHATGGLKSKTTFNAGDKQQTVSYDAAGKEVAKMIYKRYLPFEGKEIFDDKETEYSDGKLTLEVQYYAKTKDVFLKKTTEKEVYFSNTGEVLGELLLKTKDGYSKPWGGRRYMQDYLGGISAIETYIGGVVTERTNFTTKKVAEDSFKRFKKITQFDSIQSRKTKEITFYSNDKVQSAIDYEGYAESFGTYYSVDGEVVGTYDYKKKHGTFFHFFYNSDDLELHEKWHNGKMEIRKRYDYGDKTNDGKLRLVLIEDIDISCCALYNYPDGTAFTKVSFKDGLPWEGTVYNTADRGVYTISEGKRNGLFQKLDYNKKIISKGQFKNDLKDGVFEEYDHKGVLRVKEQFKAGELEGETYFYGDAGEQIAVMSYTDGRPWHGTRLLSKFFEKNKRQETYKNGVLIERRETDENGKRITKFKNGDEFQTTAYYKGGSKKRLTFTMSKSYLDGPVIRYNENGKEQHRALFSKGKLQSGTVYITPGYGDRGIAFMKLHQEAEKLEVVFFDEEGKVIFKGEEYLSEEYASFRYIDKLDINLKYLDAQRLY